MSLGRCWSHVFRNNWNPRISLSLSTLTIHRHTTYVVTAKMLSDENHCWDLHSSCTHVILSQSCTMILNHCWASMPSNNAFRQTPIPPLFNNGFKRDPLFNNEFLCSPIMVTKPNPLLNKVGWCTFSIHLRSLNLRYFKMFGAIRVKVISSRSHSMAWPGCCILRVRSKAVWRDRRTHRELDGQTDKKSNKPIFNLLK
jgi:hypothetical protein